MRSQSFTTVVGLCLAALAIFVDVEVAIAYTINHTHQSWSALPWWQKLISLFWLGGQPNFFAVLMSLWLCGVAFGVVLNIRTTQIAYALLHYRITPVRPPARPLLPSLRLGDWPLTVEQRAEYLGMGRGCFIVEAAADNRVRYVEEGSSLEF
ncbi:MAG: hypothetical protein HKL96_00990, partial [Phycisphaerales bacterium]|nr:hypothetical protein [Phycisphaerales bacterium]